MRRVAKRSVDNSVDLLDDDQCFNFTKISIFVKFFGEYLRGIRRNANSAPPKHKKSNANKPLENQQPVGQTKPHRVHKTVMSDRPRNQLLRIPFRVFGARK